MNVDPALPYFPKGIHGIGHAKRVLILTRKVSVLAGINSAFLPVLEFCAWFHDIGRTCDGEDPRHGFKSITKLKQHSYFGLHLFDQPMVHYIIENHCITDTQAFRNVSLYDLPDPGLAITLLKVFKDADNLDRVRLGDLDPSYLRIPGSEDLVAFSQELYNRGIESGTDPDIG